MTKFKNYTGFGETHGLREWARLLDVNKDTLRYWLVTKGATIEEFAEKNNIKYETQLDEGRTRINRMAQAEMLLTDLFDRSGYDPEEMEAKLIPGTRRLRVFYCGGQVGAYNLDTGAMSLNLPEEGVNLIDYPVPDPKIFRYPEGWGVHPETRRALVNRILSINAMNYTTV